jgi:hypothetical protein
MFKLTIRELLLAMTLTAVVITWNIDSNVGSKNAKVIADLKMKLSAADREVKWLEQERQQLHRQIWRNHRAELPQRWSRSRG